MSRFLRTHDELREAAPKTLDYFDASMLMAFWLTDPAVVRELLPPPLEPARAPIAGAFIGCYPRTNFGPGYSEGALYLRATHAGTEGNFCLAMHLDDDMAMAVGREIFGFPKKLGRIGFAVEGNEATGSVDRFDTRHLELRATLGEELSSTDPMVRDALGLDRTSGSVNYNVKHFYSGLDGLGFDGPPKLVRHGVIFRPRSIRRADVKLTLGSSRHDPWSEVPILQPLGGAHLRGDHSMLPGEIAAEIDARQFAPYARLKWDWWPAR